MSQRRGGPRNADRSDRSDPRNNNQQQHHQRHHRRPHEEVVKARATRGYAEQWWAQRWIGTLESFGWSNRLARGKSYATSGQVIDYHITPGEIVARVQGSRPKPYVVKIAMHTLTAAEWDRAIARMASSASYAVRLLTGEMPQDIEDVFTDLGSSLLPTQEWDLKTSCSCPDYANPCKHIAAVHYVLGEAFDQDPFLIFQLRGRSRQDLLSALRAARGGRDGHGRDGHGRDADHNDHLPLYEPLPQHPSLFWRAERLPEGFDVGMEAPRVPESILARLGSPGPWIQASEFVAALSSAFQVISHTALKTAETSDQKPRKPKKSEDNGPAGDDKGETQDGDTDSVSGRLVPKAAPRLLNHTPIVPAPPPVPVVEPPAPVAVLAAPAAPKPAPAPPAPAPEAGSPRDGDAGASRKEVGSPSPRRGLPVAAKAEEPAPAAPAKAARRPRTIKATAATAPVIEEPAPVKRTTASQPTSPALLSIASSRRPEGLSEREVKALELARTALITTERYRNETGISSYEAREELFSLQIRGFLQREGQGRWTSWSLTPKGQETLDGSR